VKSELITGQHALKYLFAICRLLLHISNRDIVVEEREPGWCKDTSSCEPCTTTLRAALQDLMSKAVSDNQHERVRKDYIQV